MTKDRSHFHSSPNLDEVIADYCRAKEAGEDPDPEAWIAKHPELAEQFRAAFSSRQCLEQTARRTPEGPETRAQSNRFGDYELQGEIARGGMGVIYRARQVSANRMVAVKMILAGQFASETEVLRFRNEAELAANLDHPNVVPIYEVGEHEGQNYFSMKLIEGESLSAARETYLDKPEEAARLMIKVAQAVHHAHQRGLLHRDLKPGNILMGANNEPGGIHISW